MNGNEYTYETMLSAIHTILYYRDSAKVKDNIIDAAKVAEYPDKEAERYVAAVFARRKPVVINPTDATTPAYTPYPQQSTVAPPPYSPNPPKPPASFSTVPDHPYNLRCKAMYESGTRFPWTREPSKCKSFCEPYGTGQAKHPENWTEKQLGMYEFLDREFREQIEDKAEAEGLSPREYVRKHNL